MYFLKKKNQMQNAEAIQKMFNCIFIAIFFIFLQISPQFFHLVCFIPNF